MKLIACPHCGDTYPDFDVAHMCSRGPYAPQLKPRMNERIRELAEQVYGTQATEQEIKFAELIVRECAKEAFEYTWNEENYQHYNDVGWLLLPGDLKSHIEEHFGVEE